MGCKFVTWICDGARGPIMICNFLTRKEEQPPRADKSAGGAINRPLRVSWLFFKTHNRRWPRSIDTRSTLRGPLPTPDVAEGPTTWPDYFVNVHIIHRCIIGR